MFCPYCDGEHRTPEQRTACHKQWLTRQDDLFRNPRCIYHDGPPHPDLASKLDCEQRWVRAQ